VSVQRSTVFKTTPYEETFLRFSEKRGKEEGVTMNASLPQKQRRGLKIERVLDQQQKDTRENNGGGGRQIPVGPP